MAGSWALGRILLRFPEGHPMHGLEVLMRRRLMREPEIDEYFEWLSDEQLEELSDGAKREYAEALTEHRCAQFARLLIRWNFTEIVETEGPNGEIVETEVKVPPTAEGVGRLDVETFTALWLAYDEATTRVAPPLPQRSDDGERSEVESTLPQESLSDSPPTLSTL